MIGIEWKKKNLNSLEKKMNKLIHLLPMATKDGIQSALLNTQEKALENKRGSKDKSLIPIEIVDFSKEKVVGRVYTDKTLFSYASFLEYGTGTYAELPHIGKTHYFTKSGYTWWLLPVDKASKKLNNKVVYSEKTRTYYYVMFATRPYPFMRPTAFATRQQNVDLVSECIRKKISEVLK